VHFAEETVKMEHNVTSERFYPAFAVDAFELRCADVALSALKQLQESVFFY